MALLSLSDSDQQWTVTARIFADDAGCSPVLIVAASCDDCLSPAPGDGMSHWPVKAGDALEWPLHDIHARETKKPSAVE